MSNEAATSGVYLGDDPHRLIPDGEGGGVAGQQRVVLLGRERGHHAKVIEKRFDSALCVEEVELLGAGADPALEPLPAKDSAKHGTFVGQVCFGGEVLDTNLEEAHGRILVVAVGGVGGEQRARSEVRR